MKNKELKGVKLIAGRILSVFSKGKPHNNSEQAEPGGSDHNAGIFVSILNGSIITLGSVKFGPQIYKNFWVYNICTAYLESLGVYHEKALPPES